MGEEIDGKTVTTWCNSLKPPPTAEEVKEMQAPKETDAPQTDEPAPKAKSLAVPKVLASKASVLPADARMVMITEGRYSGQKAAVIRVAGMGNDKRYRVQLEDGQHTWVDRVKPIGQEAPAASETPKEAPADDAK